MMKNLKVILITIILILAFAVGGFYAGMKYQQSQGNQFLPRQGNGQFNQMRSGRTGFRPVTGEIISADDKTITVKLQDGSSKIIILSEKTAVTKSQEGSKSDLKVGEKVVAFGTQNSDGSITAQNISIGGEMLQRSQQGSRGN